MRSGYGPLFTTSESAQTNIAVIKHSGNMSGGLLPNPMKRRCMNYLSEDGKKVKNIQTSRGSIGYRQNSLSNTLYRFYENRSCGVQIHFDGKIFSSQKTAMNLLWA